jgi:Putative peptidoglycan binding domain
MAGAVPCLAAHKALISLVLSDSAPLFFPNAAALLPSAAQVPITIGIDPTHSGELTKGNDMLLPVMTAKKNLIAALTAATIAATPAAPALAWGEKEQSFVAGVATAVIIDELLKQNRIAREARRAPEVVYVERPAHTTTSIYRTPAARAFQSYSLAERKEIQRNLRAWGYYRGGIDGAFGPGTYNAVVAYARDEGTSNSLKSTSGAYGVYDGLIF